MPLTDLTPAQERVLRALGDGVSLRWSVEHNCWRLWWTPDGAERIAEGTIAVLQRDGLLTSKTARLTEAGYEWLRTHPRGDT